MKKLNRKVCKAKESESTSKSTFINNDLVLGGPGD